MYRFHFFQVSQFNMKNSVHLVLFFLATGIGIVTAANVKSATTVADAYRRVISGAGTRVNRQVLEECRDLAMATLTNECQLVYAHINMISTSTSAGAEFFFETLCFSSCRNAIVGVYEKCLASIAPNIPKAYRIACSQNSNGEYCFTSNVTADVRAVAAACPLPRDSCCETVNSVLSDAGCCLNIIDYTDFSGSAREEVKAIESSCGVDIPDCAPDGSIAVKAGILAPIIGALAMLITILLPGLS